MHSGQITYFIILFSYTFYLFVISHIFYPNCFEIVIEHYLFFLDIDMTQAIGCNEKSSQCIKEIKDYSSVEAFQKMFCP